MRTDVESAPRHLAFVEPLPFTVVAVYRKLSGMRPRQIFLLNDKKTTTFKLFLHLLENVNNNKDRLKY